MPTRDHIPDDARAMVRTSYELGHGSRSSKLLLSCSAISPSLLPRTASGGVKTGISAAEDPETSHSC